MRKDYYVYAYIRDNGTPYYIGKGQGRRATDPSSHVTKPKKDKSNVVIIVKGLTERKAFAIEKYYIREYGRLDISTGILRNRTVGGEGGSGYRHTKEYIQSKSKRFTLSPPSGGILKITNLTGFCRDNSLDQGAMCRVIKRVVQKQHKGWRCVAGWELTDEDTKYLNRMD